MKPYCGMKFSKTGIILFAAVSILITIMGLVMYIHFSLNRAVAFVNGEPLALGEYRLFLQKNRAMVIEYYQTICKTEYSKNFWAMDFDGTTPEKALKQKALQDVIRIKVQQHLARQMKIADDFSYRHFLTDFNKENARRKDVVKKGGVIYGPRQYDEQGYYDYCFNNMVIELKNKLAQGMFRISGEQLKKYYDSIKERLYKIPDSIKINQICIPVSKDTEEPAELELQRIRAELKNGKSFDDIKKHYEKANNMGILFKERLISRDSAKSDTASDPALYEQAVGMDAGGTSEIFEENGSMNLLYCVLKASQGYQDFEVIKDSVMKNYVNEKYASYIDKLVKEADLILENKEIDKMKIE